MVNWLKRIIIFLNERMRIKAFLPLVLLLILCHAIFPYGDFKRVNLYNYLYASLFYLFSIILMRICDEFKDAAADIKNFPMRCIPRGAVSLKDIKILFIILAVLSLILFSIVLKDILLVSVFIVYLFFFAKFFFIPKILEKNIILALVTHNPILLIIHFIIFQILFNLTSSETLEYSTCAIYFWFFSLAWEVARKIRLPRNETGYVTYSGSIGHQKAIFLLSTILTIQYIVFLSAATHIYYLFLPIIYIPLFIYTFYRFLTVSSQTDENRVIKVYESYTFLSYINIIMTYLIL